METEFIKVNVQTTSKKEMARIFKPKMNARAKELRLELTQDIEAMKLQILRLQNQIVKNEVVLREIDIMERMVGAIAYTASMPNSGRVVA